MFSVVKAVHLQKQSQSPKDPSLTSKELNVFIQGIKSDNYITYFTTCHLTEWLWTKMESRLKDSHSNIEIPSAVVPGLKALGLKRHYLDLRHQRPAMKFLSGMRCTKFDVGFIVYRAHDIFHPTPLHTKSIQSAWWILTNGPLVERGGLCGSMWRVSVLIQCL